MGKYSLDGYERYPVIRCRPQETGEPVEGAGIRRFQTVRLRLGQLPELTQKTLLLLSVGQEETAHMAEAESALRSLAAAYCRHPLVLGVTVETAGSGAAKRRLWETAAEAFAPRRLIIPIQDGEQLDYALKHGFAGGILARIGKNPYDTCEAFAEQQAQQLFKRMPVLVSAEGCAPPAAAAFARQWHAAATENIPDALAGWRIALRRLVYPRALSSGGFAPLQFWWTNQGPSFFHGPAEVRLRMVGEKGAYPIALQDKPGRIPLADRVHNEIVRLPETPVGDYRLEYGIFDGEGNALTLCHHGRTADGYYPADVMHIDDTPRPEYQHIWDDYSPDGYYPLEDPKVPGT